MRLSWSALLASALVCIARPARADDIVPLPDWIAVHGQGTFTLQGTPGFASPYAGTNSLTPHQRKETIDATLFLGVQPWKGGELWVNPEVDQGFGLSNTLGAAGFVSAEAYKVGKKHPYTRLQRLFFRQTIDLGGARETVDGEQNQFAGTRTADRLVVTIGKFGVGDVFDTNKYAHDPRGDFLNWALVDTGSFDYAADAWGYSSGVAVEWYRGPWTVRAGAFHLSTIPNGEVLEKGFGQYQIDAEIEHRHQIVGRGRRGAGDHVPQPGPLRPLRRRAGAGGADRRHAGYGAGAQPQEPDGRRRQHRAGDHRQHRGVRQGRHRQWPDRTL